MSESQADRPLTGRVLLVDDDPDLLRAFARALRHAGHTVETARDGAAAATLLGDGQFDCILTDIDMPGMDGLELLRFARQRDLDVPVVLITGRPDVDSAAQAVEQGALRYLVKPVELHELEQSVVKALQLHRLARIKRRAVEMLGRLESQVGDLAGLDVRLTSAIDSLWMAYQPIVSWRRKRVFAYEALLRSSEAMLPNPGAILTAAERLDRVHDVSRRIRRRVAEMLDTADHEALVFVNLHPTDLCDDQLFSDEPLSRHASRVVLEITERAALDGVHDVRARITDLRHRGYRIALDDLGAGYAGLSSLAQLDPDFVKIDMSLVRDIHREPVRRTLVRSMAAVCEEMGIQVVAEGIEIGEERDALVEAGCDLLQGYLFARPDRTLPDINW